MNALPGRGPLAPQDITAIRQAYPQVFATSPPQRCQVGLLWTGLGLAVLGSMWQTGFFDGAMILRGLDKIGQVVRFMLPPAHNGWLGEFTYAILETLALAAGIMAMPLGYLGAKNLVPQWVWHCSLRRFLDGLRGVDALIWALMFVNVVGLGPFAGILALAMSDTGTLAKLYAGAIENVDPRPLEGVRAAGGNRRQVIRFGVLPQILPIMLSHVLYYFESNTRSATTLGVVGAGGIDLHLSDRIRVNNWDEACYIILLILLTVILIDMLSQRLRVRVI